MHNRQLNLFEQEQRRDRVTLDLHCYVDGGLLVQYGGNDFCFFNPLKVQLKDCEPEYAYLELGDTEFWNRIKSLTWSTNCKYFIVVNENEMILGVVKSRKAVRMNLSIRAVEQFIGKRPHNRCYILKR